MTPDLERLRRAFDAQLAEGLEDAGPPFTRRRVFGRIGLPGKVTSVIGMRRAGKTTFLHQLRAESIARGAAPWQLPFLRLEEERFAGLDALSLGVLIDEYPSRYLDGVEAAPEAWFLDEIQVVPGWERLVRRLLDSRHADLYISGSSAGLLSREIATVLIELERRGCEVTYVRTPEGYEVDFLARSPSGETELIQVCADASDAGAANREIRALVAAESRFPNARKLVLTLGRSALPSEIPQDIEAQPAYEWLLGNSPALPEPAPAGWL